MNVIKLLTYVTEDIKFCFEIVHVTRSVIKLDKRSGGIRHFKANLF